MNVLQLCRYDRLGASSRLRFYDYGELLRKEGITITQAPFFDDAYLNNLYAGRRPSLAALWRYYSRRLTTLSRARRYNLIWLEKEALPWLPVWLELPLLRHVPFVIDLDDAWFHRYDLHRDPMVRYLLEGKFPQLVGKAAAVIAGNQHLAGWAKGHGAKHVVRIPTTVDPARYTLPAAIRPARPFTVGWMGSPSSAVYLQNVAAALREVATEGELAITLVGSGPVDLPGLSPRIVEWREDTEAAVLNGFDVGIMPLAPDRWSEGKCAYKLIQYMAAGLPVVASPIGMNREVVRHGENGFLASTHEEWVTALATLRDDPGLRHAMGMAGRAMVEQDYSLSGTVALLAKTLREAAQPAKNPP